MPNQVSGEFYNIAVVMYDVEGRIVDARFTPDFRRMRCNPIVEIAYLSRMREQFEERRLLGEDFSGYLEALILDASNSVNVTELIRIHCVDVTKEVDRLVGTMLATPIGLEDDRADTENRASGKRAVRLRITEAFARHGLFRNGHDMRRDVSVEYGSSGLKFVFDFAYRRPSSEQRFVQALSLRAAEAEAGRLCLVLQESQKRSATEMGLTIVAEDTLGNDVRDLLAHHGIGAVNVSAINGYAESIRSELGL